MTAYILIIVALQTMIAGSDGSFESTSPTVTMQEFANVDACLFAMKQTKELAAAHANQLRMQCVPKGGKS